MLLCSVNSLNSLFYLSYDRCRKLLRPRAMNLHIAKKLTNAIIVLVEKYAAASMIITTGIAFDCLFDIHNYFIS